MAGYLEIFCGLVAIIVLFYYYLTSNYDFWKLRGVPGPKPVAPFGNIKDVMLSRMHMVDYLKPVYDNYKNESMFGIFARNTPILILNDPELIKDVLIKDFSKFADRGMPLYEKMEPLSQHLVGIEAKRWRPLRTKFSPVFTSGKLKGMFGLIVECAEHLERSIEEIIKKEEIVECRELTAKYTTDVIGSCVFGIEMNALSDEESEFRRVGRNCFKTNFSQRVRGIARQVIPRLYNMAGYIISPNEHHDFFLKLTVDTMAYRQKNNIVRQDFIDLLLELKTHPEKVGDIELTDTLLAAQAFVFFLAGFETSSTTMSNALYELALNHDVQDKLRNEIKEEFDRNGGCLKYEEVKKMKYLDKVFRETLRKYPPATLLMRQATVDYTFDGTKVTIPKGQKLWVPVYAIHRDSDIYPNPDIFDPERFSDEAVAKRHPMQYLPFGDGPRNCIGARFAVYQSKLGLIKILHKFKVDVCEKTMIPYENDPAAFLLAPKEGIYLKISKAESM